MILTCYLGGEKMKLKIMKFFAVLLAAFLGIGALKPCEALEPLPPEVREEISELYFNYQIKKSKATNITENFKASMEFFAKFENLKRNHNHVLVHMLNWFCRNDIPASIKNYSEITTTFTTFYINRFSGRIVIYIGSFWPINGVVYSFEL